MEKVNLLVYWTILRPFCYLCYCYLRYLAKPQLFEFQGRPYECFYHIRGLTHLHERTVEIPIAIELISKFRGRRILEIGNVLSNYTKLEHDIVDKYETAPGVINQDVVDFRPGGRYDLIMSISTLEHVGWDEQPQIPDKIPTAIEHLKTLLAPLGTLFVTVPLDYNKNLDMLLDEGKIAFTETYFIKRVQVLPANRLLAEVRRFCDARYITSRSTWREVSWEQARGSQYGAPFKGGNTIMLGLFRNSGL